MSNPELIEHIAVAAQDLHGAGALSPKVLRVLWRHLSAMDVRRSVETGAGASTLVFSHLSPSHLVFAIDAGSGSIERVRTSALFNSSTTRIIEGPTQRTLPVHPFDGPIDAALLDGPHAFPFPALEYFYIYPHLAAGALLVVDDIHIRSTQDLFRFLSADAMFEPIEVVDRTAFFRRTDAPVFDPFGDGWERQGYNARLLPKYVWRERVKRAIPPSLKQAASSLTRAGAVGEIRIREPEDASVVQEVISVSGTAQLPQGANLWLLARRADQEGWWPQGSGPAYLDDGRWTQSCTLGGEEDSGAQFEVAAVGVGAVVHEHFLRWVSEGGATGVYSPVRWPECAASARITIRRR